MKETCFLYAECNVAISDTFCLMKTKVGIICSRAGDAHHKISILFLGHIAIYKKAVQSLYGSEMVTVLSMST